MSLRERIPAPWRSVLADELEKPYFRELDERVAEERRKGPVFPAEENVFHALALTPPDRVRVVILGQDPYHDDGQAHGLAFSVPHGVRPPPSLVNIFTELRSDLGHAPANHGCLVDWAKQGVLLLNAVLTVRAHRPNSHKGIGWERFTDAVLQKVDGRAGFTVYVLWGAHAQKKKKLLASGRHLILEAAHPSPLSARNGFFGSKPFSTINFALRDAGLPPINWQLPDI
jgi:uracil-DNA glycosylase